MKLTKEEAERILKELNWSPLTESIINKLKLMTQPKPPKYFPIETAPINQRILVWDVKLKAWGIVFFDNKEQKISDFFTHWRPMPKGPKNV